MEKVKNLLGATLLRRLLALFFLSAIGSSMLFAAPSNPIAKELVPSDFVASEPGPTGYRERAAPLNVIVILADDLGAHDLGCYGADLLKTPEIDRFAETGMRFTRAYAPSPVCTPSRASLLTGKHPARLKMTIWSEGTLNGPTDRKLLQAYSRHDLALDETTLTEVLQSAGYLTATVGKWHLGDARHAPETQGFDINIGGNHWGAPASFFYPYRGQRGDGEFRYLPGLSFGHSGEYLTDRLTDEALRVIDHAVEQQRPFFLMLSHHAPHTPIEAKGDIVESFERTRQPGFKHQHSGYAAMVASLDQSVGRVLDRIEEQGLGESTIVIFTSDNGGYIAVDDRNGEAITNNWPLRSGKGSLYEGGVRVPLIVRAPNLTSAGSLSDEAVVLTDLFPTLLAATGSEYAVGDSDGISLVDLLQQSVSTLQRDALYFHYPHYYHAPATRPCSSVALGKWKLIEDLEDGSVELYDLAEDPSEQNDVAESQAGIARQLRTKLHDWRRNVEAELPLENTR